MPRAREKTSLSEITYDIAGNAIRAYYDKSNKLVFVLDETINDDKPNVLLVIDSFDERKWDDVLVNDYGVDLENVRPKRDNKYQKLDIEYGGLDVYATLIDADESGDDLDDALTNLARFRIMSVRRSARERLAAANDTINKSHETIERTNDAIVELRARVKKLRARVSDQRGEIGREPTKASAAKILKTEAQIDATNEKLARAKKRLASAQRRLTNAEDDAEIARAILARDMSDVEKRKTSVPARVKQKPVVLKTPMPIAKVDNAPTEPEVEEMPDDEVKPLFDKDPENLDDEIAFKPIDFGSGNTDESESEPAVVPAPLSFVPPAAEYSEPVADEPVVPHSDDEIAPLEPVVAPVVEPEPIVESEPAVAPITPVAPVRPVSPIVGVVAPVEQKTQKSTLMYYIMLVLLILLSIGTLWLYQKSTNENIPDLAKPVAETNVVAMPDENKKVEQNPFIAAPDIIQKKAVEEPAPVVEPEPVAAQITEPEPVVVETESVATEPESVAVVEESVVVDVEPVAVETEQTIPANESPFLTPEPAVTKIATYEPEPVKIPSEAEVIASKPGYNVSQNEKMFVASSDYDTETVYTEEDETEPSPCENGAELDGLGCCPGEEYTYTDDGFMCCNSVECFPPAE